MSDSKLDYGTHRTTTGVRRPYATRQNPVLAPATKLDLPGTGQEFADLAGINPTDLISGRAFYLRDARQVAASAAGVATLDFGEPPTGYYWMVERLVVKGAGIATVYIGNISDLTMSDFTPTAAQDVADESSPIYIENGANLLVQFTGAGAGTICTATVQIREIPTA
jgi:hypothetical protein